MIALVGVVVILRGLDVKYAGFNVTKISQHEYYRLISSLFYSNDFLMLLQIVLSIICLSLLRESVKCSIPFMVDLVLKQIWVTGLSILIYILLHLAAKSIGGFFIDAANFQE